MNKELESILTKICEANNVEVRFDALRSLMNTNQDITNKYEKIRTMVKAKVDRIINELRREEIKKIGIKVEQFLFKKIK